MEKKVPLHEEHEKLGAKLTNFGGWIMPVEYTGIIEEHNSVRNNVGVFDVSHMGQIDIYGSEALELVQWLTTNNASKLKVNDAQYSMMCNDKGGIIDDVYLYRLVDSFRFVVNASNIEKDYRHIQEHASFFEAVAKDISDSTAMLAIQGPKSNEVMLALCNLIGKNSPLPYKKNTVEEIPLNDTNMIVANTGYTGENGFELMLAKEHAEYLWKLIFEAGKEFSIKPIGLGARDTLRLEMGYCLYGNDINDERTPLEAGLEYFVDLGKNFCGKEGLLEKKINNKLVCFEMLEKGIPRQHYKIFLDEEIGEVTSGTFSPTLKKGIGMGYVKKEFAEVDTEIRIEIRSKKVPAKIFKKPFVKKN